MNTSLGDTQAPNLASFFQARSLGAKLVEPAVVEPFGIDRATTVSDGAALVIVDESPMPLPPDTNETFSYDNVAHEHPRRRAAIQQLMLDFWRTGVVANPCTGTCDCAAGNCGDLRTPMYGGT